MGGGRHYVHLNALASSMDEMLDDHGILVSFILNKQRILGLINKPDNTIPSVERTPDKMRVITGIEMLAMPIGIKAPGDFLHFMPVVGDNRVIARFGQIFRGPVQGLHDSKL